MATEPGRQSFWAQNRWALPLLLALIIVAIVLAVILGPKLKGASSAATATPTAQQIVVTSTPGTPGTAGATATPGQGPGAATPLPGTTPVPTEQGKTLGEITRPQSTVTALQSQAGAGSSQATAYLDPRQTVVNSLPNDGFPAGSFQIVSPAATPTPTAFPDSTDASHRPIIRFIVNYQGRKYQVTVAQPGTRGPKGIWSIVTILPPGYY